MKYPASSSLNLENVLFVLPLSLRKLEIRKMQGVWCECKMEERFQPWRLKLVEKPSYRRWRLFDICDIFVTGDIDLILAETVLNPIIY